MKNSGRLSFYEDIRRNKINSGILIAVVFFVLIALSYFIGLIVGGDYFWMILFFGTIISIIYVVVGYSKSSDIALASVRAKKAPESEFRQYHNLVEGLCIASGMPKPKLYIMDNKQINAFASGKDPKNAVICVTTGTLEKLDKRELEGVLAHELSHIANYDIRFMTLVAVLVGMISLIAQIFLRSLFWSSIGGGRRSNNSNGNGQIIIIAIGIALAILSPIIVALVQLAISRRREYMADSSAVKFMRSPTGLIGALTKIKNNSPMKVSGAVAPLFLANPKKERELFMTHPPLEKRIEKLKRM